MAETTTVIASPAGEDVTKTKGAASGRPASPRQPLHQIYALPAPIRTFPLPAFYPNNPLSLLHLAYAWLSQVFRPPPSEPSVVHVGVWDPETRSVHVRDAAAIRALWEQGFYGKGSLSRSEPNWLKSELARRGLPEGKTVSEARIELRREERRLAKWERAKTELEAIEKQRLAEAAAHPAVVEPSELNGVLDEPTNTHASLTHSETAESSVAEAELPDAVEDDAVVERAPEIGAGPAVNHAVKEHKAPVGPAELLALPNSLVNLLVPTSKRRLEWKPPVGPAELLLLPNSVADLVSRAVTSNIVPKTAQPALSQPIQQAAPEVNAHVGLKIVYSHPRTNGAADVDGSPVEASALASNGDLDKVVGQGAQPSGPANGAVSHKSLPSSDDGVTDAREPRTSKRRKSVRFSPTVESTTFLHSDPPSPNRSPDTSLKNTVPALPNEKQVTALDLASTPSPGSQTVLETAPDLAPGVPANSVEVENKEHFQLAPEEAFFLVFALGALHVVEPVTGSPISTEHLLSLLRSYSYFPPRSLASGLRPDDSFLVNYAVYHHFRSLGWVPRHGIKFGVDWILYQRGPVFDHSEFGIRIMPSYSSSLWEGEEHEEPKRSWSWLMGVHRVLSHALKSLVLVYVDIPPPSVFDEEMRRGGIAAALKKYAIREVMVRRFSVNRNR